MQGRSNHNAQQHLKRGAPVPYRPLAGVEPCPGGWFVVPGKLQGVSLFPEPGQVLATITEVLDTRPSYETIALHAPIGLPGERIDIDTLGRVTINGVPLDESYLAPERNQSARNRWASVREDWKNIKQHYYFVMGDNRDMSNDSRSWGLVPEKYIYGKAMFRYWPLQRMGSLDSTADYDPEQQ